MFHPQHDNLFVAGLIQPDSGQWGLVDYQAQLIARFVAACRTAPAAAERFRRLKRAAPARPGVGHSTTCVRRGTCSRSSTSATAGD